MSFWGNVFVTKYEVLLNGYWKYFTINNKNYISIKITTHKSVKFIVKIFDWCIFIFDNV